MRAKKNKKKLLIAVIFGVVAIFGLLNSMNEKKNKADEELRRSLEAKNKKPVAAPVKETKIKVVVAAKDIKVGDNFVLESLKFQEYDKEELPKNYFKTKAMIVGKKANRNISIGGFITAKEIQLTDSSTIEIPNDTRAITIPVGHFKGLASYIKVGSKVDILKMANPPEFIAQNIKVVGFEAKTNPNTRAVNPANLTSKQASAITFLVPLNLVSTVIDAMSESKLQLITRNNNDEKILVTEAELPPPPAEIPTLPDEPMNEPLPKANMPEPEPKKIEFIKASNISTVKFDAEQLQGLNKPENDSLSDEKLNELLDMVN